jgi:transposase
MSKPIDRVEIISGMQRRRRYTAEEKVRLVEQTMQPGMTVSAVARLHGVAQSLLFQWRRRMTEGGQEAVRADEEVVPLSRVRELEGRVRELERLLGRKTMETEILRAALIGVPRMRRYRPRYAPSPMPGPPMGIAAAALLNRARRKTGTLQDFVRHIAANPGRVNLAGVGVGSSYHLLIEQIIAYGKLNMTHVPYRGGAAATTDFLAGRVDATLAKLLFARPYLRDNRALGVAVGNAETLPRAAQCARDAGSNSRRKTYRWACRARPRGHPGPDHRTGQSLVAGSDQPARHARMADQ